VPDNLFGEPDYSLRPVISRITRPELLPARLSVSPRARCRRNTASVSAPVSHPTLAVGGKATGASALLPCGNLGDLGQVIRKARLEMSLPPREGGGVPVRRYSGDRHREGTWLRKLDMAAARAALWSRVEHRWITGAFAKRFEILRAAQCRFRHISRARTQHLELATLT
jgi:hypothetical protein